MNDDESIVPKRTSETLRSDAEPIEVGQWYHVARAADEEPTDDPPLRCVVHVGSNFAKLEDVEGSSVRILFTEFDTICTIEPNADAVIAARVRALQGEAKGLMAEVQQISARLAVSPTPELDTGATEALARVGASRDMKDYGAELTLAKETTLPELFSKIKRTHEKLGVWLAAPTLSLRAQTSGLKGIVTKIEDRILDIGLYAGLVEQVVQITDGAPATIDAKLHLLQRRCYMDEECLLAYEAGGMEFEHIDAFDQWLARPANRDRILPFPRCIVAFRVRRNRKERETGSIAAFIRILGLIQGDESTFLYIRNGEQLFRLETDVDFGEKLFPDLSRSQLSGKLWANVFWSNDVRTIISDDEYQGLVQDDARKLREWRRERREARKKKNWRGFGGPRPESREYVQYSKDNVHYDDITAKIQSDIRDHNRIALIIQGLFDRSPVLHPHLPHKLWTPEGFEAALELVYDDSRTLVPDAKPDFEAYRARLNASLCKGSITVGQEDAWARVEAEKESDRRSRDWRNKSDYHPEKYYPWGNPGPGLIAEVVQYSRSGKKCTYQWLRQRQHHKGHASPSILTTFRTDAAKVLNVSAYTPGDYKQFFADPRTRAEYLKWAPLLLAAEDYHAGKQAVGNPGH